ncbi:L-ascorbate metabolism protein UlaG (beta-lactamase superfamily) [Chitinophaga skermanii]|uniref:L-ascorbate metabolism protein UlaG (Beta-lactamase superfamily) n=1 Tax=Chitinophaga skermanii TaxID=331697 RepID=A0A327R3H1_9BACT|nr:MBL fold metallo-hydrolase [Chitinophaga skermanii]RAJ08427.1 L-ascorbate metabolism protein UlaG (beta-lactamase superfamily) [Chitinophaga skermanii]
MSRNSIQLVRNATLVIQYAGKKILLDPMFSPKGAFRSFAGIAPNPTIDLTGDAQDYIKGIDLVLVTHTHPDHFDEVAAAVLPKDIPLFHQPADTAFFQEKGFVHAKAIEQAVTWEGITISRTGGQHGSGEILERMGTVSGFVLQAANEPTVYMVGDSIWVEEVQAALQTFQPGIVVVNSGGAAFPGFESAPILMEETQAIQLVKASGQAVVIAVHMESLDHCLTTRASLRAAAEAAGIPVERLIIPQDGETVSLN